MPGLYGSNLFATYNSWKSHWYCSNKMDNKLFWVDAKYAIPPTYNCLFEMLRVDYDEQSNKIIPQKDISIDINDFGGESSIATVDKGIPFNIHAFESFGPMLDFLKGKGYKIKQDLYGVPYDWRLAMDGFEDLYPKYQQLIEEAYNKNNNEKVTVLGFSLGCNVIQYFLAYKVSAEWKQKYIRKVIFVCPAFGGSGQTLDVSWNQYFPILSFLKSSIITETIMRTPVISALFPNHVAFGDDTIIKGPNGEKFTASQVSDFLIDHQKFTGKWAKILKLNEKYTSVRLDEVGVPTYIVYNSLISTVKGLDFSKGYNKDPSYINEGGDGTVPKTGPEWVCNQWNQSYPVICHDIYSTDDDNFDHSGISYNPYVHRLIYEAAQEEDWTQLKGNYYYRSPHVDIHSIVQDNIKIPINYTIREDIRPFMRTPFHEK